MSEPFLGELRIFGFTFPPRGWAFCDGQLLAIAQNTALFSLVGTTYGGNGQTNFALPDLRGRVPLHPGQGSGLSNRVQGERSGSEIVTLTATQIPAHSHSLDAANVATSNAVGNQTAPDGNLPATANDGESNYSDGEATGGFPLTGNTGNTGGSQPHENMPPFLAIPFSIALLGIYPSRT